MEFKEKFKMVISTSADSPIIIFESGVKLSGPFTIFSTSTSTEFGTRLIKLFSNGSKFFGIFFVAKIN